jgi:hypothetical protein
MGSSTPIMMAMGLAALVAAALGYVVNLVARRSLVNPWLLGVAGLALAGAANAWLLIRAGVLDADDAFRQGELLGEFVGGPVILPLLLLVWQARRYSFREEPPEAAKGSFKFAVGVTLAFVLFTALFSAVAGSVASATAATRAAERRAAAKQARVDALIKVVDQLSMSLPKAVDDDTVLFKVTADDETLEHHYRLINLAKADVDPGMVAAFRADIMKSSCGKKVTRDQFLRKGYVLQHSYYDKDDELVTSIDVTEDACAALER